MGFFKNPINEGGIQSGRIPDTGRSQKLKTLTVCMKTCM